MNPATKLRAVKARNRARSMVGEVQYVYGAEGAHADDCSGLTAWSWRAAGIELPHNAAAQLAYCRPIPREQLDIGDLVFYYSPTVPTHVAIVVWRKGPTVHVVQATNEQRGVEMIEMDAYTPSLAYGRPGKKAA